MTIHKVAWRSSHGGGKCSMPTLTARFHTATQCIFPLISSAAVMTCMLSRTGLADAVGHQNHALNTQAYSRSNLNIHAPLCDQIVLGPSNSRNAHTSITSSAAAERAREVRMAAGRLALVIPTARRLHAISSTSATKQTHALHSG